MFTSYERKTLYDTWNLSPVLYQRVILFLYAERLEFPEPFSSHGTSTFLMKLAVGRHVMSRYY